MTLVIILFNVFTPQGLIISKKNRLPEGRLKQERKTVGRKGVGKRSEKRKKKGEREERKKEEERGGIGYRHNARAWRPRIYR